MTTASQLPDLPGSQSAFTASSVLCAHQGSGGRLSGDCKCVEDSIQSAESFLTAQPGPQALLFSDMANLMSTCLAPHFTRTIETTQRIFVFGEFGSSMEHSVQLDHIVVSSYEVAVESVVRELSKARSISFNSSRLMADVHW